MPPPTPNADATAAVAANERAKKHHALAVWLSCFALVSFCAVSVRDQVLHEKTPNPHPEPPSSPRTPTSTYQVHPYRLSFYRSSQQSFSWRWVSVGPGVWALDLSPAALSPQVGQFHQLQNPGVLELADPHLEPISMAPSQFRFREQLFFVILFGPGRAS